MASKQRNKKPRKDDAGGREDQQQQTVEAEAATPSVSSKSNRFTCTQCLSKFKTIKTLNDHIRRLHMEFSFYLPCHICTEEFKNQREYSNHMALCGVDRFTRIRTAFDSRIVHYSRSSGENKPVTLQELVKVHEKAISKLIMRFSKTHGSTTFNIILFAQLSRNIPAMGSAQDTHQVIQMPLRSSQCRYASFLNESPDVLRNIVREKFKQCLSRVSDLETAESGWSLDFVSHIDLEVLKTNLSSGGCTLSESGFWTDPVNDNGLLYIPQPASDTFLCFFYSLSAALIGEQDSSSLRQWFLKNFNRKYLVKAQKSEGFNLEDIEEFVYDHKEMNLCIHLITATSIQDRRCLDHEEVNSFNPDYHTNERVEFEIIDSFNNITSLYTSEWTEDALMKHIVLLYKEEEEVMNASNSGHYILVNDLVKFLGHYKFTNQRFYHGANGIKICLYCLFTAYGPQLMTKHEKTCQRRLDVIRRNMVKSRDKADEQSNVDDDGMHTNAEVGMEENNDDDDDCCCQRNETTAQRKNMTFSNQKHMSNLLEILIQRQFRPEITDNGDDDVFEHGPDDDDDEAIADLFMPELIFPDDGEFFEFNRPDTRVLRHYVGALDFESVALPDGRFQAISYSIAFIKNGSFLCKDFYASDDEKDLINNLLSYLDNLHPVLMTMVPAKLPMDRWTKSLPTKHADMSSFSNEDNEIICHICLKPILTHQKIARDHDPFKRLSREEEVDADDVTDDDDPAAVSSFRGYSHGRCNILMQDLERKIVLFCHNGKY